MSGYGIIRGLTLEVGAGASASGTVVSSATAEMVSGGTASSTHVQGGGAVLVLSGGTTVDDVLVGSGPSQVARETVFSGGVPRGRSCPTPAS